MTSSARGVDPSGGIAAMPPLPVQRRVADTVYELIRDSIVGGRLAPGSRLSVPLLAEQLTVSRSPVREAVQRLVQDGLATEEPHRGALVAVLDPAELVPLYEVREVLEGLAARLAATAATDRELADLAAAHDRHAASVSHGGATRHAPLDMAFHAVLRRASHNEELQRSLERVQGRIAIAIIDGRPESWSRDALAEHAAVLEAVLARDPDAAERAARAHIRRVRHSIADLAADTADAAG